MADLKAKKNEDGTYQLRNELNEPVFTMKKSYSYGRDHAFEWHPQFLKKHPELEHSVEFGKNKNRYQGGNKEDAIGRATNIYNNAAKKNFRDTLETKTEHFTKPETDQVFNHQTNEFDEVTKDVPYRIHHYYDRDTGERIGSSEAHTTKYGNPGGGHSKFTENPEYVKKHNIHPDILDNLKKTVSNAYDTAVNVKKEKGKEYSGVGESVGRSNHIIYKTTKSPEEASLAHEKYIAANNPTHKIVRHSPTSFTAVAGKNYSHDFMSHVIGDKIHEIAIAKDDYDRKPTKQVFESKSFFDLRKNLNENVH